MKGSIACRRSAISKDHESAIQLQIHEYEPEAARAAGIPWAKIQDGHAIRLQIHG
jgi:hypothetical protein